MGLGDDPVTEEYFRARFGPLKSERGNLPSASAAHADSLCPGRHILHTQFPSEDSEWSKIGHRIHLVMAGYDSDLSIEEKKWIEAAKRIEERIFSNWDNADEGDQMATCHREKRLWAYDPFVKENDGKTNSGQADVFWVQGKRALLADYKSLFGDVPDAPENLQLRDLVVFIHLNYGVTEVTAYINQPRVTRNPKLVVYGLEDLKRAEAEMRERVKASMDPNSKRVPGEEQCKYCNGKLVCEEFKASAIQPLSVVPQTHLMTPKKLKEEIAQTVAQCEPGYLVSLRDRLKLTEMLQTAVNAEIRKRLTADGTSVPGLKLAPGDKVRQIKDVLKTWDLIIESATVQGGEWIDPQTFSDCCSLSIGDLEKAVAKHFKFTADEAKQWVNETLGPIITLKANAASIERVKG